MFWSKRQGKLICIAHFNNKAIQRQMECCDVCLLAASPPDVTFDAERGVGVVSDRGTGRPDIAMGAFKGKEWEECQ